MRSPTLLIMSHGRDAGGHIVLENRFVLEQLAGSGGMGDVYKALDLEQGGPVAVKVMRDGLSDDASRFVREARILSELNHPYIVRHIAHGLSESGAPWLAMEWLEGEDLSDRLSRGRLPMHEALDLAACVAAGLGFAHGRGITHRDLKPSNIFLVGKQLNNIRILDFGIARIQMSTHITRTGMLIGTPAYMSPEQARGESNIDARTDIYSLGCVLFECLTGTRVFTGSHIAAMLAKILFEEPPRLRDRIAAIPEALDDFVARMLSKEAGKRWEDGEAVVGALKRLGPLHMPELDPTLEMPPPQTLGLTGSEKRSVAVILIGAPKFAQTQRSDTTRTLTVTRSLALVAEAERYGGHCELLLDGSVAMVLTGKALATDIAAQGARLALSLRSLLAQLDAQHGGAGGGNRPIALAMGRVGSTERILMDQAIDRAAKLCSLSAGLHQPIFLDEVVAGLLDARFDVREYETGFVLQGERELAEGTRTLLGKATPCVGRERELRHIEENFQECIEENVAQAVLVMAPAGVGKSRLGQEFLRTVHDRVENISVWVARGDSLRAGSPLGMLAQALRGACGVREGEALELRREKLLAHISEYLEPEHQRRVAEFLGEIIGTPFPDSDNLPLRAARLDAQLMADQTRAAFLDFLGAVCKQRPVLVLLEDLHWSDRSTVQFLDRALRDLSDRPLFLLALGRPEVRETFSGLWAERKVLEIRLKELNRKAIERLVKHVLRENAKPDTIERIARLSEGNAFYLEELIRFAADGKGGDLPETVIAMVQSRLGALDDACKRVLRAASVFGEVSWTGGVAALLGGMERKASCLEQLESLVERELLIRRRDSRFPGEEEFAFRHALLREGAYSMLTEDDRALGHKLSGEWLEERGEDDSLLLAEHFEKGREASKAGHHYLRASERAYWSGDSIASIAHARRGLSLKTSKEQRIALLGAFCVGHFWHLDLVISAHPHAEELLGMVPPGSPPWCQGMIIRLNYSILSRQQEQVEKTVRELMRAEPTPEGIYPLLLALSTAAIGYDIQGHVRMGNEVMVRMTEIAESAKDHIPGLEIFSIGLRGSRGLLVTQNPEAAVRDVAYAGAISASLSHSRYVELFELLGGINLWCLGVSGEAEQKFQSLRLPDEEFAYMAAARRFCYAWLLSDRGQLDEARPWAMQLIASGKARNHPLDQGRGHWIFAEVLRRTGEFEAAHTEIESALQLLRMVCPLDVPGALATRSALCLSQNKLEDALASAEEGMDLFKRTGVCSQFFRGAFLRLVHAQCHHALGRHDEAQAAIQDARAAILSNAQRIQSPVYRKNFLEDVPENHRTFELAAEWLGESK